MHQNLFSLALLILSGVATAADAPPTTLPEKPIDARFDWSGWYFGGHTAYDYGNAKTTLSDPQRRRSTSWFANFNGGVQIGYAYSLPARFVLGLEADVSFPNFFRGDDQVSSLKATRGNVAERMDCVGTVRGRVGYAFDRWLLFGTGGFAWSLARYSQQPGLTNSEDDILRIRSGWTVGAGIEVAIAPNWTARLEYGYDRFGKVTAVFPSATGVESATDAHSVRLGFNWYLHWPDADTFRGEGGSEAAGADRWSIHGQFTFIEQGYPRFTSPYEGANSLSGASQLRNTASATFFLGVRVWNGGELYFNPELMQGFGLSDVRGVAAFPNGEAQKSDFRVPRFNVARLFFSQTFGLGGERETIEDDPNQVSGERDVSRITVSLGKFAVTDYFLVNSYAGEPRTTFLNWNIYGGGSYDWTMDKLSWTWGLFIELNQKFWALRAGYFLLPAESNSDSFDIHIPVRGQYTVELELRYVAFSKPGKVLFFGWLNHGNMGGYADALAEAPSAPGYPDITLTRSERVNYGFVVGAEQAITDDLGVFSRASFSPGRVEIMGWTDCHSSFSLGAVLKGNWWRRPGDTIGLAGVVEGLSPIARRYFGAGGLGILIGDGRLNYRPEMVLETYYAFSPVRWVTATLDYQLVVDPGYNADRGPVSIFSVRLHAAF